MLASDNFCNIFAMNREVSEIHIFPKSKKELNPFCPFFYIITFWVFLIISVIGVLFFLVLLLL